MYRRPIVERRVGHGSVRHASAIHHGRGRRRRQLQQRRIDRARGVLLQDLSTSLTRVADGVRLSDVPPRLDWVALRVVDGVRRPLDERTVVAATASAVDAGRGHDGFAPRHISVAAADLRQQDVTEAATKGAVDDEVRRGIQNDQQVAGV